MSKAPTPEEIKERVTFYATVGQGISNWARMEGRFVRFAADLLDCNVEKAGVVFYSINFNTWLNIIEDLLSLDKHLASVKSVWGPVSSDLRKLNDIRVRLAHHTAWQGRGLPPSLMPAQEDRRKKSRLFAPLTATEVLKFTNATTQMEQTISDLQRRLIAARMAL